MGPVPGLGDPTQNTLGLSLHSFMPPQAVQRCTHSSPDPKPGIPLCSMQHTSMSSTPNSQPGPCAVSSSLTQTDCPCVWGQGFQTLVRPLRRSSQAHLTAADSWLCLRAADSGGLGWSPCSWHLFFKHSKCGQVWEAVSWGRTREQHLDSLLISVTNHLGALGTTSRLWVSVF